MKCKEKTSSYGFTYSPESTAFCVWAPTREHVYLNLYKDDTTAQALTFRMNKEDEDHCLVLEGDYAGFFYTYRVNGVEVTDPYSVGVSMNSERSAILDLRSTDPENFRNSPYCAVPFEDAIIYEMHVGDFTFHASSGSAHAGKFLALTEEGTVFEDISTGLDHLVELGVTHVHLMPVNDYITVDENPERFGADNNYNWGYDPELYNVPEGSYATNPRDPKNRIRELKEAISALHSKGIGVVLDVVYNHTYKTMDSNFNILVPNYYYRMDGDQFSNGSGVGNELATEKENVRRFIIESLLYWQDEYRVDGFRFDLMALLDRKTISMAIKELRKKNPFTLIYGEPWTGARSTLAESDQVRWSCQMKDNFALFNDAYRNFMRGDNDASYTGFIQGNISSRVGMLTGILGSVDALCSDTFDPTHTINYFNSHDNLILEDQLQKSSADPLRIEKMTKLAFGILLTSQGIPFFHAGNEFRRSKKGNANSYCAPYTVNALDWSLKKKHYSLYRYVRDIIQIRKEYDVFRLRYHEEMLERVSVVDEIAMNAIALLYKMNKAGEYLFVVHYNGWADGILRWEAVFEKLNCYRMRVQKIFDGRGKVEEPCFRLQREERQTNRLSPIETVIYRIEKESANGL